MLVHETPRQVYLQVNENDILEKIEESLIRHTRHQPRAMEVNILIWDKKVGAVKILFRCNRKPFFIYTNNDHQILQKYGYICIKAGEFFSGLFHLKFGLE